ncbi:hypothetical protein Thiowin_04060 [Thiorhodovibrio winogradskyi]|uniref:Uncharacterized protein n=1 Tax=Thiorhodovibrio winogradskyi TaxID=77007 RepID=A0ABZ0SF17_9GAMM|nr:hypothetical protein [Thiorhodovibrio winogradskyi]
MVSVPNAMAISHALFMAAEAKRARLDRHLNRLHRRALADLSRFLGDEVRFFDGRFVSLEQVPF